MSAAAKDEIVEVLLQLTNSSWTGMNWRADPHTGRCLTAHLLEHPKSPRARPYLLSPTRRPPDNENWPRNGSILRGVPSFKGDDKWLHCTEIKQAGTTEFKQLSEGYWMVRIDVSFRILSPLPSILTLFHSIIKAIWLRRTTVERWFEGINSGFDITHLCSCEWCDWLRNNQCSTPSQVIWWRQSLRVEKRVNGDASR